MSRVTHCETYHCSHITTDLVTPTIQCSGNILYYNIYLIPVYYSSVVVDLIVVSTSTYFCISCLYLYLGISTYLTDPRSAYIYLGQTQVITFTGVLSSRISEITHINSSPCFFLQMSCPWEEYQNLHHSYLSSFPFS